eukprot:374035-Pelagomonas_calceolata.AAC.11
MAAPKPAYDPTLENPALLPSLSMRCEVKRGQAEGTVLRHHGCQWAECRGEGDRLCFLLLSCMGYCLELWVSTCASKLWPY